MSLKIVHLAPELFPVSPKDVIHPGDTSGQAGNHGEGRDMCGHIMTVVGLFYQKNN